jgi:hypothetical protein
MADKADDPTLVLAVCALIVAAAALFSNGGLGEKVKELREDVRELQRERRADAAS